MAFIVKQETQLNASTFLNEARPLAVRLDNSIKSKNAKTVVCSFKSAAALESPSRPQSSLALLFSRSPTHE